MIPLCVGRPRGSKDKERAQDESTENSIGVLSQVILYDSQFDVI